MYGDSDGTSLISDSTSDSLTDPPGCIGRKLESSIWIEFINCSEKSYIALLDEIEESESTTHILLGDRYDESEIGFCETLASLLISLLDEMSESDLFFCIDEVKSSDLIEIHTDRVIRDLREVDILILFSGILEHIISIE
jgi:hypothetical protein